MASQCSLLRSSRTPLRVIIIIIIVTAVAVVIIIINNNNNTDNRGVGQL